jgi:hypothetical protein
MNREELEMRIWGKSIATARKNGSLSEGGSAVPIGRVCKRVSEQSSSGSQKAFRFIIK